MISFGYFPFCIKKVSQEPDSMGPYPTGFSLENLMNLFWNFKDVVFDLPMISGSQTRNPFPKPYLNSPSACGGGYALNSYGGQGGFESATLQFANSVVQYGNQYYPSLYAEGLNAEASQPEFAWPFNPKLGNYILYTMKILHGGELIGSIPLQISNIDSPNEGKITATSTYYF